MDGYEVNYHVHQCKNCGLLIDCYLVGCKDKECATSFQVDKCEMCMEGP